MYINFGVSASGTNIFISNLNMNSLFHLLLRVLSCFVRYIEEKKESLEKWTSWTTCTVSCGQGVKTRFVLCNTNSSKCIEQKESCNKIPCPIEASRWTEWSKCSKTCGEGIQIKFKICVNEINCRQIQEVQTCMDRQCIEASWSLWSQCSFSCGGGTKNRFKICHIRDCKNVSEISECNNQPCFYESSRKKLTPVILTITSFLLICLFVPFCVTKFRNYKFMKPIHSLKMKRKTQSNEQTESSNYPKFSEVFHGSSSLTNLQRTPTEANANIASEILMMTIDNKDASFSRTSPFKHSDKINLRTLETGHFHQVNSFLDSGQPFPSKHKRSFSVPINNNNVLNDIFVLAVKKKVNKSRTTYVFDEIQQTFTKNTITATVPKILFHKPFKDYLIDIEDSKTHVLSNKISSHEWSNGRLNKICSTDVINESSMKKEKRFRSYESYAKLPKYDFNIRKTSENKDVLPIRNTHEYDNVMILQNNFSNNSEINHNQSNVLDSFLNGHCLLTDKASSVSSIIPSKKKNESAQTAIRKIRRRSVKTNTSCNILKGRFLSTYQTH